MEIKDKGLLGSQVYNAIIILYTRCSLKNGSYQEHQSSCGVALNQSLPLLAKLILCVENSLFSIHKIKFTRRGKNVV